jgi:hypothetical protein
MEGRLTGSRGADRAARFIAERLRAFGIAPAFGAPAGRDSAFFQRVPMRMTISRTGWPAPITVSDWAALDTVPPERRVTGINVVGVIPGGDPVLREQVVVIAAHYDHLGIRAPVAGDSVYNGADDDASGVVAVLEAARAMVAGPAPRRTVVVMLTTGEEQGKQGTLWYMRHPVRPLERTIAELEIEMIGRPDSAAGGAGRTWLTGFERSDLGPRLAAAGVPVIADPRPEQRYFQRSDNIVFACLGIPAHTLSSGGSPHAHYHQPQDDVARIDFAHLTQATEAGMRALRSLANEERPSWKPGANPANDIALCGQYR